MKYTLLISLFLLTACHSGPPWKMSMMDGPPGYDASQERNPLPELYLVGWREGCETGISSNTNSVNKFFYKYRQNASLVMNDTYYRGWKDAFDYCQRYTRMYYSRQFP